MLKSKNSKIKVNASGRSLIRYAVKSILSETVGNCRVSASLFFVITLNISFFTYYWFGFFLIIDSRSYQTPPAWVLIWFFFRASITSISKLLTIYASSLCLYLKLEGHSHSLSEFQASFEIHGSFFGRHLKMNKITMRMVDIEIEAKFRIILQNESI